VNTGVLGSDVKNRDAVIVYPKGKNSKEAIEVPLTKTKDGYTGDKIVLYDQLDKLTDEGTKIDVAIFDHDKSGGTTEEMHVSVAVSTGKSCEKAIDENPQTVDFGKKNSKPDLTDAQLGAPMKSSGFFSGCGLPNSANADICVAVKQGKVLGASVNVTPKNNRVAACIDRSTRRLSFPQSDKLDVVHQKF
jgi:microcompartment protein CcmK/EutM